MNFQLTKSQKALLFSIISALLLVLASIILKHTVKLRFEFELAFMTAAYIIAGRNVFLAAFKNIKRGKVFDENFLMCIATIGAYVLGDYTECVAVMLFYQAGEFFQSYAVSKSRKSIKELMNICPEYANIEDGGKLKKVSPYEVEIDDIIVVTPGEKVPLDAVVEEGCSYIDMASLTGESMPKNVKKGDSIFSGSVNLKSALKLRVTKSFENSTVSKILELVENSAFRKAKSEKFITRFASFYTPAVVICAFLTASLPPLFFGSFALWFKRALIFLVVSCPCALVVSVPLGFFASIGCASKHGILIKGANYLEALGRLDTIVFDKTGTLTEGNFNINEICPVGCSKEELMEYGAACEFYSNHPLASYIKNSFTLESNDDLKDFENISGLGVSVVYKGKKLFAGNKLLMNKNGIFPPDLRSIETVIHVCCDNKYMGYITLCDKIKKEAFETVNYFKNYGIKTCMLTGDSKQNAIETAKKLGIDNVFSELMPDDKVNILKKITDEKTNRKKTVAYVGDGINDAPVISLADVGIAMGSLGSDAAIEAADIVITDDNIKKISLALRICRKTNRLVKQNVVFAIGTKVFVMILGVLGLADMWAAIFADVGVAFIAILNSMRAFKLN